jgi:hypothetical protein
VCLGNAKVERWFCRRELRPWRLQDFIRMAISKNGKTRYSTIVPIPFQQLVTGTGSLALRASREARDRK